MIKWHETKKFFRSVFIVAASVTILVVFFHLVSAGTLNPTGIPNSSMRSASEIYESLAGTFDSSGIAASSNGDALQIAKCIIQRMAGNSCP